MIRTLRIAAALLAAWPAVQTHAQLAERLQVGIAVDHWMMDVGTASSDGNRRTSIEAELGVAIGNGLALQLTAGLAPQGEPEPGFGFLGLEVRSQRAGGSFRPFLEAGAGVMRVYADRLEYVIASCVQDEACLFEGVGYRSGNAGYVSLGVGTGIPLGRGLALEPELGGMLALGGTGGRLDGETAFFGLSVGLAWRGQ